MGTETLMLLAALSCSGMCCLAVAGVLLGGVIYVMTSNRSGGSLPMPFSTADSSAIPSEPPMEAPVASQEPVLAAGATIIAPHDGDLGPPVDPHAPAPPPRSSGQTIIAFDDEDDDF